MIMETKTEAQKEEVAKEEAPRKPPLSVAMSPDDYCARATEDREAALEAEEKAMKERHEAEVEALKLKQEGEVKIFVDKREALKTEVDAIRAHVDMWQRQAKENTSATPAQRDSLIAKHDAERIHLARETGYEVRQPTLGDTTVAGFPVAPLPGHPWIRPIYMANPEGRLHPQI
jgi:hypothetical protein